MCVFGTKTDKSETITMLELRHLVTYITQATPADSGVDEQGSSPTRGRSAARGSARARRGYWAGGRPTGSGSKSNGGKRRLEDEDQPETSEPKSRRVESPVPMEVEDGSRTRKRTISISSTTSEETSRPASPARPARVASPAPEDPAMAVGLHTDMVHLIFSTWDVRVPPALRTGFRPVYPYPFTGMVTDEHRERVRETLELAWIEEAARQTNPSVGSVSIMMQLRTSWRWEQGWRRSRRTGEWLFMGDPTSENFQGRLESETEDRSNLRGVALRRLATMVREEDMNCPRGAVEAERRMREHLREIRLNAGELRGPLRGIVQFAADHLHGGDGARPLADTAIRGRGQADGRAGGQTGRENPRPTGQAQQGTDGQRAQGQQGQGNHANPLGGDGARARAFPAWPWSRGRSRHRAGEPKKGKKNKTKAMSGSRIFPQDPWIQLQSVMARFPALFEWLHRVRTTQHLLMSAHPNRDHIRRVVESEELRSVELARSLLRSQEITGAATLLDISWPPANGSMVVLGRPGMFVPGAEMTDDDTDEEDYQLPPPPHCAPWREGRGRGGRGGRRGGRRGGAGALAR